MADELHPGSGTYTHDTQDIKGIVIEVDGASAVSNVQWIYHITSCYTDVG
jgi:hypothetical protein